MSYIVKNCPCIKHYDDIELDNRCMGDQHIPFFCENNPDCVIKQVIDYCLEQNLKYDTTACEILQLFDIEEVRE